MEWQTGERPADGTWCWVTNGKGEWIAKSHHAACGGWTNEDTWEDFSSDIIAWIPIPLPPEYKQSREEC